jgi:cytochrome c peroxidase
VLAACFCALGVRAERDLSAYKWHLPKGFPQPLVPAGNPMSEAKVILGNKLFNDTTLSNTGLYACSSCHRRELAFTDGRAQAIGATGEMLKRSSMSLANVAYQAAFTWGDAAVKSLEAQMQIPLFNEHPVEMGLQGRERGAIDTLLKDPQYPALFAAAFPDERAPVSVNNVVKAVASYERTLISGRAAFDRYVFDDDQTALTASAKRGMALFYSSRTGCVGCHFGINFSGSLVFAGHETTAVAFANTGLYNSDGRGAYPKSDQGLIEITRQTGDMGKFRVPTLRNVALTAPYMHDGSIATLSEVIDHYAQGGRQTPRNPTAGNVFVDPRIKPFALTPAEKDDMIAFLKSLTDEEFVREECCAR